MRKSMWLLSAGLLALSTPAYAQETDTDASGAEPTDGATAEAAAVDDTASATTAQPDTSEIIVTATRRNEALSDVPLAVSAVTAQTLENSGASDIRQLNQVSPSLLVSSTSSEAGAGGARIRGIGTVGDNAGLESSVAVFIDGVYRSRIGVGLTELGQIDRVEVLRGPQGTLFGRNASAGLISVITAKPKFNQEVAGEITLGNYNLRRGELSVTGPLSETVAYRLDGVYVKRDGYMTDVISGRDLNDRNRWLLRGQMLFEPSDNFSVRVIGDFTKRNEECCGASYLPAANVVAQAGYPGYRYTTPNSIVALQRALGAVINEDTYDREMSITPGRSFRSDVTDYGLSAEAVYDFGGAELTSITAYRYNNYLRGQDADFNNLDILVRDDDGSAANRFKTFTQELRLQGNAGKLDWLVGGYFANEKLRVKDNLSTGADFDRFFSAQVSALIPGFPGYSQLNAFAQGFVLNQLTTNAAFAGVPAAARPTIINAIASQVVNTPISNMQVRDVFNQEDTNFALFTHNIFKVTDKLSLTGGLRYTHDKKTLDAELSSTGQCANYQANIVRLRTLAATATANPALYGALTPAIVGLSNALATQVLTPIGAAPCFPPVSSINGSFDGGSKSESEWSGTGVVSYKLFPETLVYASFSRGYKAGGFNLDRAGLNPASVNLNDLQFAPEKVDAYEAGLKYNGQGIDVNVAVFRQFFRDFQLNTFNGTSFVVENINSCSEGLNGADTDLSGAPVACGGSKKYGVSTFGVEAEAFFRPFANTNAALGATYVDTRYEEDLIGTNGNALIPALFQLPGRKMSNAPEFSLTGSFGWTPPIGSTGMKGLAYIDFRHTSSFNTGSDLDLEKIQDGFNIVNARIGLTGANRAWGVELWAQNLFDAEYKQVAFDAPLQGSGATRAVAEGLAASSNGVYAAFLGEPRTFGLTLRGKF